MILAGVSISLVVGDNGVLTRARNSSDETKRAQMKEAFSTAMGAITTEYYGKKYVDNGGNSSTTLLSVMTGDTTSGLKYELEKAGYTFAEIVQASQTYKIKEKNNTGDKPYLEVNVVVSDNSATVKFAKTLSTAGGTDNWEN